jgi:hypothetical protein
MFTMSQIPTANVLKLEANPEAFTGYVAVSHTLMQTEGFADFLFDNFLMIQDLTTRQDGLLGLNRFIMQSDRFREGYGQYKIKVKRLFHGGLVLGSVHKVA